MRRGFGIECEDTMKCPIHKIPYVPVKIYEDSNIVKWGLTCLKCDEKENTKIGTLSMTREYGWEQLSQWDLAPHDAHIEYVDIQTGLSKATCRYMLVERTYQGNGCMKCKYIKKSEVSTEELNEAVEAGKSKGFL